MSKPLFSEIPVIRDKIIKFTLWTPEGLMVPFEITPDMESKFFIPYDESDPTLAARLLCHATGLKVTVVVEERVTASSVVKASPA
jgi:hypothetical protein